MKSSQKSLVAEQWVINASPVIALARVGQVELLVRLPKRAVIPRAVEEEILSAPENDPACAALISGTFKMSKRPPRLPKFWHGIRAGVKLPSCPMRWRIPNGWLY